MKKEIISIQGFIKELVDGKLVRENHNAIHANFKEQIYELQNGNPTAIDLSNLFTSQNTRLNSLDELASDGIAYKDAAAGSDPYYTMETTVDANPFNTTGIQYKGVAVLDRDVDISELVIGKSTMNTLADNRDNLFSWAYAYQDKSGAPLSVLQGQLYEVLWGIWVS